jgi:hypothetical protein
MADAEAKAAKKEKKKEKKEKKAIAEEAGVETEKPKVRPLVC